MQKSNIIIILLIGVLIVGMGLFIVNRKNQSKILVTSNSNENISISNEIETTSLTAPDGGDSSGVATRQRIDNIFVHGITADLAVLAEGQVYVGWLAKNGDLNNAIKTGNLQLKDGVYGLDYSSPVDYMAYPEVVITTQSISQSTPGTIVLNGAFQE